MTDKTPAKLADQAGDAVRSINHLTQQRQADWEFPGDAYSVVGNLAYMAGMLPQTLEQISRFIIALDEEGRLHSDKGDLQHDVTETVMGLEQARVAAEGLYAGLNRAQAGLGSIAYRD